MAQQWYVIYSEMEEAGVEVLSIGPHEDDHADAFAFSLNYTDGIPDEIGDKFSLMAAAPALLTACECSLGILELRQQHNLILGAEVAFLGELRKAIAIAKHGSEEPLL